MSTLKKCLVEFLRNKDKAIVYPPIETRILQLSPLQITDDYLKYIEINSNAQKLLILYVRSSGEDQPVR